LGVTNDEAHRAYGDAKATAQVALALLAYSQNPPKVYTYTVTASNTYALRETLKSFGFRWQPATKEWVIRLSEDKLAQALTYHENDLKIYGIKCKETPSTT